MSRDDWDLTAVEWFEAARRCYIEAHQGCAHCAAQHCVFLSQWGRRAEYHCMACDFSASHDEQSGRYYVNLGEPAGFAPVYRIPELGEFVS